MTKAWLVMCLMLAVIFVGVNFDDKVNVVLARAFGREPFGVPVAVAVSVAEVLLLLPFFASLYHFLAVVRQGLADGRAGGALAQFAYLLSVGRRHPHLRRAQFWAALGWLYFLALCGVWIAYAEWVGV